MISPRGRVLIGSLLTLAVSVATACDKRDKSGDEAASGAERVITGKVNDAFGEPVAGAQVAGPAGAKAITDEEGAFELKVEPEPREVEVIVSKAGFTQKQARTRSNRLAALALYPVPEAEGVYLIDDDELVQIPVQQLETGSAETVYRLGDAEIVSVRPGSRTFILHGFEASHFKQVQDADEFPFGPGLSISPTEVTHAISGGGELLTQTYSLPAGSDMRFALANFVSVDSGAIVAEGNEAALVAVSSGSPDDQQD